MNRKLWIAGALVVAVSVAGCVPRGDTVTVDFDGEMNTQEGEFRMEGELTSQGGIPEQNVFESVTVSLYMADKTVICRAELGNLHTDYGRVNASLTAETIPHSVVFDSPDFWNEKTSIAFYVWTEGDYEWQSATSRNDLPVATRSASGPSCGTPE